MLAVYPFMFNQTADLKSTSKPLFFIIFLWLSTPSFAQSNFYKFTVGGGYGLTLTYPDTKTVLSLSGYGSLDYNLTPFSTLGLEIQKGKLSGGDKTYGFVNNYTTITLNGKVHVGEFMGRKDFNNFLLNSLRGIYIGAGIGVISNKGNQYNNGIVPIDNKDIVFPFNLGSNFYFANHWGYSRFILNFNLQSSYFLEDGLDGDLNFNSNFNDIYNYFSVGVKYNFGPIGLYQKR